MSEKLSNVENRMLRNFQARMVAEVVKHRDEKTVQWPDLPISDLLEEAEHHLTEARRDYCNGLWEEARKNFAHVANFLAMAYDNLDPVRKGAP